MTRLILAGLFVFGCVAGFIYLLPQKASGFIVYPGALLVLFVAFSLAQELFKLRQHFKISQARAIQKLEESGQLDLVHYQAVRAFGVEEFEDEGSSYYIELSDGSVLFLSGQYLYEYEACDDDVVQGRKFPCTNFTLKRHKREGYVVEIVCRGNVIEPEIIAPPFSNDDINNDLLPEDGQIITNKNYDQLKAERTRTN